MPYNVAHDLGLPLGRRRQRRCPPCRLRHVAPHGAVQAAGGRRRSRRSRQLAPASAASAAASGRLRGAAEAATGTPTKVGRNFVTSKLYLFLAKLQNYNLA